MGELPRPDGATESTSHVEQQIAARIAKVQAARKRRDDLAQARRRGLARRHAQRLRNLAEAEARQGTRTDLGRELGVPENPKSGDAEETS